MRVFANFRRCVTAFMSPEVVSGEAHDGRLADVWSLGATVYCLLFGRPPFVGRGREASAKMRDLFQQIRHDDLAFPEGGVDAVLRSFLGRCLEKSPERRMTLDEARDHPWLRR